MLDIAIIGWVFNLIIFLWAMSYDNEDEAKTVFGIIALIPFGLFILFFYALILESFK